MCRLLLDLNENFINTIFQHLFVHVIGLNTLLKKLLAANQTNCTSGLPRPVKGARPEIPYIILRVFLTFRHHQEIPEISHIIGLIRNSDTPQAGSQQF